MVPNLLLQKFPAPNFTVSTKISLVPEEATSGKTAGLIIMGMDYATLSISHDENGYFIKQTEAKNAINGSEEKMNGEEQRYQLQMSCVNLAILKMGKNSKK